MSLQGSLQFVSRLLLFLIYVKDVHNAVPKASIHLIADDTNVLIHNKSSSNSNNKVLATITDSRIGSIPINFTYGQFHDKVNIIPKNLKSLYIKIV